MQEKFNIGGINSLHTIWVFGLGFGMGKYFITGSAKDIVLGFIDGIAIWFFFWFIGLLLFGDLIKSLYKLVKRKFLT